MMEKIDRVISIQCREQSPTYLKPNPLIKVTVDVYPAYITDVPCQRV